MKQMAISCQSGFSTTEIEYFRLIVYKNVVDSAKEVVRGVGKIGLREALELRRKVGVDFALVFAPVLIVIVHTYSFFPLL
jgi:hypothetical protein